MASLPLAEIAVRKFYAVGISGSALIVQHLVLIVAFLGAGIAARKGELLSLATTGLLSGKVRQWAELFSAAISFAVCLTLSQASLELVVVEREGGRILFQGIPVWIVQCIMPMGFTVIGIRALWRPAMRLKHRLAAASLGVVPLILSLIPETRGDNMTLFLVLCLLFGTLLGTPIFVSLGGIAAVLLWNNAEPLSAIPSETYSLSTDAILPTIPLFTLAGYILAEGGTPRRLILLFQALFGWMPGGVALVSILVCAFFTSFTGGSGVTILAMGGLLFPILIRGRYPDRFSTGLLTSAGSLGLLLPPSLAVILYSVVSQLEVRRLFLSGLTPALLELCLVSLYIFAFAKRVGHVRIPFSKGKAAKAVLQSGWEVAIPIVLMGSILSGLATLVEAAALTVLYALFLEFVIRRELGIRKDLLRISGNAATLIGGVLIILGVARGLTNFLIFAQVPDLAVEWVQTLVHSKICFLLLFNLFLLVVGCLMDIFSAVTVVVPLILPVALAFGVDPFHLGIIFLVNLELGFLTPPVGMNLFLASYRFKQPLSEVYSASLPFLGIRLIAVLLITYVPLLTGFLPKLVLGPQ
jgi:tripartite ATP-independent transporter DctM subunit